LLPVLVEMESSLRSQVPTFLMAAAVVVVEVATAVVVVVALVEQVAVVLVPHGTVPQLFKQRVEAATEVEVAVVELAQVVQRLVQEPQVVPG
jgi:hypothetical protein